MPAYPQKEYAEVVELFKKGKTVAEIRNMPKFKHLKYTTVYSWVQPFRTDNNTFAGGFGYTKADVERLQELGKIMYEQGLSDEEIAKRLELDYTTVNKWFKERRIKDRKEKAKNKQYDIELVREVGTYFQKMSASQVSVYMDMDVYEVEEILRRYKITKGMM